MDERLEKNLKFFFVRMSDRWMKILSDATRTRMNIIDTENKMLLMKNKKR